MQVLYAKHLKSTLRHQEPISTAIMRINDHLISKYFRATS